ncbi:hypothetical protein HYT45_00105 [Candidatus Uhrbacteria bacterium]|nr:hypothetical protein [Candidatus Uhrbacteria bacterium]
MRSFHLALILFVAGFACKEEPRRHKRRDFAEQKYCGDRPISSSGCILSIPPLRQECSEHCWATVLEMLGTYYGREARVCELAGIVRNHDRKSCCSLADICGNALCNKPLTPEAIDDVLSSEFGLESRFAYRILLESELQTELSNGRPVIVGYAGREKSHVALITSFYFEPDRDFGAKAIYLVADPFNGFTQMDYEQIIEGVGIDEPMPWEESWWRISPREDGCNERYDPLCGCESSP